MDITYKNGKAFVKNFVPHDQDFVDTMREKIIALDGQYLGAVTIKANGEVRFFNGRMGVKNGKNVQVTGAGKPFRDKDYGLITLYLPHEVDPKTGKKGIFRTLKMERLVYLAAEKTSHLFTDNLELAEIVETPEVIELRA